MFYKGIFMLYFLMPLCLSFTQANAMVHSINRSAAYSAATLTQVQQVHDVSRPSVYNHQQRIQILAENITHNFYAAITSLKFKCLSDADKELQVCCESLEELKILFNTQACCNGRMTLDYATCLVNGIEHIMKNLTNIRSAIHMRTIAESEMQDFQQRLERLNIFRMAIFASCIQWSVQMIPLRNVVCDIESYLDSIENAVKKSSKGIFNSLMNQGRVRYFGVELTEINVGNLKKLFQGLHDHFEHDDYFRQLPHESIEYFLKLCKAAIQDLRPHVRTTTLREYVGRCKDAVDDFNNILVKSNQEGYVQAKASIELEAEEQNLKKSLLKLSKHSMFSESYSLWVSGQQLLADVAVIGAEGAQSISDVIQEKIQQFELLFGQLSCALGPDGQKNIDELITFADRLKNEKAIIEQVFSSLGTIEYFVSFTDSLEKVISLAEDIATSDHSYGKMLKQINPKLRQFSKACEEQNVADALRSIKEISRTFGFKQPISQIAVILARHSATLKLGLMALKKGLMQQMAPHAATLQSNLAYMHEPIKQFNDSIQLSARTTQLNNLTATEFAAGFHTLAIHSQSIDAQYRRSETLLSAQPQFDEPVAHIDSHERDLLSINLEDEDGDDMQAEERMRQEMETKYQDLRAKYYRLFGIDDRSEEALLAKLFEKEAILETQQRLLEIQRQNAYAWNQEKITENLQAVGDDLADIGYFLMCKLREVDQKRNGIQEPICSKNAIAYTNFALWAYKHLAIENLKRETTASFKENKHRLQLGTVRFVKFIWYILNFFNLFKNNSNDEKKLEIINKIYQDSEAAKPQFQWSSDNKHCKDYLRKLDPALFAPLMQLSWGQSS